MASVDSPPGQLQTRASVPAQGRAGPVLGGGSPAATPLVRTLSAHWPASMRMRTSPGARLDLHYGLRLRNRIDYYPARHPGPLLVLLAGAYDEVCTKDDFAFAAAGLLAHGVHVAIPDTSQAPGQTLGGMLQECRAALRWLSARAQAFGADVRRMVVCGWGSGAHAAALCLDEPGVVGGMAISGVYDLARLRQDPSAAAWCVDQQDVLGLSPRRLGPSPRPLVLVCGGGDSPALQAEATRFAAWRADLPGALLNLAGQDRHTLLVGLADATGILPAHVCALLATGGASPLHAGRAPL